MFPTVLSPSLAERLDMEVADAGLEAKGWGVKWSLSTTQVEDKISRHLKINKDQRRKVFVSTKMGKAAMKQPPDIPVIIPSLIR